MMMGIAHLRDRPAADVRLHRRRGPDPAAGLPAAAGLRRRRRVGRRGADGRRARRRRTARLLVLVAAGRCARWATCSPPVCCSCSPRCRATPPSRRGAGASRSCSPPCSCSSASGSGSSSRSRRSSRRRRPRSPRRRTAASHMPLLEVIKTYPKEVLIAMGMRMAENIIYYIFTIIVDHLRHRRIAAGQGPDPAGAADRRGRAVLPGSRPSVRSPTGSAAGRSTSPARSASPSGRSSSSACSTPRAHGKILLAVVVGLFFHTLMYAPQAAFFSELFGTSVRYTGASVGYQLASIFAGALAPIIAVDAARLGGRKQHRRGRDLRDHRLGDHRSSRCCSPRRPAAARCATTAWSATRTCYGAPSTLTARPKGLAAEPAGPVWLCRPVWLNRRRHVARLVRQLRLEHVRRPARLLHRGRPPARRVPRQPRCPRPHPARPQRPGRPAGRALLRRRVAAVGRRGGVLRPRRRRARPAPPPAATWSPPASSPTSPPRRCTASRRRATRSRRSCSAPLDGGRHAVGPGRYETLVEVGRHEDLPLLTFTSPHGHEHVEHTQPSAAVPRRRCGPGCRSPAGGTSEQVTSYFDGVVVRRTGPDATSPFEG